MTIQAAVLLSALVVSAPAREKLPVLTSADGSRKIHAAPVGVEGGKVVLRKASGRTLVARLDMFSGQDRARLKRWMEAARKDPHAAVVKRAKAAGTLRVLFVGNSYSFRIPRQFEKVAVANGRKVHVEQVTVGGWTLKKHAASEQTLGKIRGGKWDVVVLQEQSQVPAFPEKQRAPQMDAPARKLAETARAAGALPVFFLTWGRRDGDTRNAAMFPGDTRDAMQKRLHHGYARAAAHAGGAYIVPVGTAWCALLRTRPATPLYAPDGSHPAALGNLLGAYVIYTALYDGPPRMQGRETGAFTPLAKDIVWRPLPYPLPE